MTPCAYTQDNDTRGRRQANRNDTDTGIRMVDVAPSPLVCLRSYESPKLLFWQWLFSPVRLPARRRPTHLAIRPLTGRLLLPSFLRALSLIVPRSTIVTLGADDAHS